MENEKWMIKQTKKKKEKVKEKDWIVEDTLSSSTEPKNSLNECQTAWNQNIIYICTTGTCECELITHFSTFQFRKLWRWTSCTVFGFFSHCVFSDRSSYSFKWVWSNSFGVVHYAFEWKESECERYSEFPSLLRNAFSNLNIILVQFSSVFLFHFFPISHQNGVCNAFM